MHDSGQNHQIDSVLWLFTGQTLWADDKVAKNLWENVGVCCTARPVTYAKMSSGNLILASQGKNVSQLNTPYAVFSAVAEGTEPGTGKSRKGQVWLVRLANAEIYRAQDSMVVARWLAEGRLLGTDEISSDGHVWQPIGAHHQFGAQFKQVTQGMLGPREVGAQATLNTLEPQWQTIRMESHATPTLGGEQLPIPHLVFQEVPPPKLETQTVGSKTVFGQSLGVGRWLLWMVVLGGIGIGAYVGLKRPNSPSHVSWNRPDEIKPGLQGAHLIGQALSARQTGQFQEALEILGALHHSTNQWPSQPALWAASLKLSLVLQEDYLINSAWWRQYSKHLGKADKAAAIQTAQQHEVMAKQLGAMAQLASEQLYQLSGSDKEMMPLLAYHAFVSGHIEQAHQWLQQVQKNSAPDSFSWLLGVRMASFTTSRRPKGHANDKDRYSLSATQLSPAGLHQLDGIVVLAGQDSEILWQSAFLSAQRGDVRRGKHFIKELLAIAPKHPLALYLQHALSHPTRHLEPPVLGMAIPLPSETLASGLYARASSMVKWADTWQQVKAQAQVAWQSSQGLWEQSGQWLASSWHTLHQGMHQWVEHPKSSLLATQSKGQDRGDGSLQGGAVPRLASDHRDSGQQEALPDDSGSPYGSALSSPGEPAVKQTPEVSSPPQGLKGQTRTGSALGKLPSTSPIQVSQPSLLQLPISPTGHGELLAQAQIARSNSQFPQAEQLYRQVLQQEPTSVAAMVGLGWTMLHGGNTEQAVSWFQKALQLASRSTEANLGLAESYAAQGTSRQAIRYYRRVMAIDPGGTTAQVARFALEKLGRQ